MGASKYPWNKWMDGERHDLYHGKDYDVPQASFISAGYGWASRNGYKIEAHKIRKTGVSIQKVAGSGMVLENLISAYDSLAIARADLRTSDFTPGELADIEAMLFEAIIEAENFRDDLKGK